MTFSTGHLSAYSIGFKDSSGGGKFPVWAIVVIVIAVLAAAGGAAAFFLIKKKGPEGPAQSAAGDVPAPGSDADGHTPVPEGGNDSAPDAPAEEPPQIE